MNPFLIAQHWFGSVITTMVVVAFCLVAGYRFLLHTEDPKLLVFKWVLTGLVGAFWIWQTEAFKGTQATGYHVVVTGVCAVAMIATWRRNIANIVARPFGALFDGGDTQIEPQPYYSVAEAKRKSGRYLESVAEIRKQLESFPNDYHGQLMLAEIQAQNLNDLPGAELTIQRLCSQPGHAPRNVVHALTTLADWYLKYNVDPEAAARYLQQIVDLFPDSEFALGAQQRIAHLGSAEVLLAPFDRKRVAVPVGVQNLGLRDRKPLQEMTQEDSVGQVADYVKRLEEFPMDFEVREKLATAYADQCHRLDLAIDQLEQMIAAAGQPARHITRWLNLMADLQVRNGADLAAVEQTLGRILEMYPSSPAAQIARTRLAQLKLEFKGVEKTAGIKMGTYEQNIGLKRGAPRPFS